MRLTVNNIDGKMYSVPCGLCHSTVSLTLDSNYTRTFSIFRLFSTSPAVIHVLNSRDQKLLPFSRFHVHFRQFILSLIAWTSTNINKQMFNLDSNLPEVVNIFKQSTSCACNFAMNYGKIPSSLANHIRVILCIIVFVILVNSWLCNDHTCLTDVCIVCCGEEFWQRIEI